MKHQTAIPAWKCLAKAYNYEDNRYPSPLERACETNAQKKKRPEKSKVGSSGLTTFKKRGPRKVLSDILDTNSRYSGKEQSLLVIKQPFGKTKTVQHIKIYTV